MKRRIYKYVSIIVCLVMLMHPVNVSSAIETENKIEENSAIVKTADLVPNFLDISPSVKSKFVSRLAEYENTSDTIGFLNEDGTNTIYIFPYNIRFKNENGSMVLYDQTIVPVSNNTTDLEKSNHLKNYMYQNKSSDVKVYFNDCITENDCILIEKEDISISLNLVKKRSYPESSKGIVNKDIKSQHALQYNNAFGDDTTIKFMPTDYGVAGNIVLSSYNGDNNTFEFILNTHGLIPKVDESGAIIFYNSQNEIVGMMPSVVVSDSSEIQQFNNDNDVELTFIEGNSYLLKYIINEDFLNNPGTVYPLSIEPGINLSVPSDAPVYSNYSSSNYYLSETGCVGYSSNWGTGRAYFKVNLSSLSNLKAEEIYYAQLALRETTGATSNAQVNVHKVTTSWSPTTITYNEQPTIYSSAITSFNANSANDIYWYYADITDTVISWRKSGGNNGVVLKANTDTTSYWRAFAKSNYPQTSMRPYLTVYAKSRDIRNWGYNRF